MLDILAFLAGVLVAVLGLGISIALHEVGHLTFAKLFGVRVPQYMVGFGPTLWSRRRGETEYGIKAIPLGGYVSMIGMYPPSPGHRATAQSTGFLSQLIEDGRQASADSIPAGEEHRAFYRLPVWQRLLIMFGGPLMNFLIAIVCLVVVVSGFGVYQPSTTIGEVYRCVVPAGAPTPSDPESCDDPAPGYAAGLEPGDVVESVDGEPIESWAELQQIIRAAADRPLAFVVDRAGTPLTLTITPRPNEVPVVDESRGTIVKDADGEPVTQTVGFVGFAPTSVRVRESPLAALDLARQQVVGVFDVIVTMPQRVADMFAAGFLGAERDPNGPMSVVGVGRITGEIAQQHQVPIVDRVATMIGLVGSLNIALGMMNLIPLPPLDGGHIAAACYDGLRRWLAKRFHRPDPGPFDAAKLLPLTIVMSAVLLVIGALFIFTDIVNPVKLFK